MLSPGSGSGTLPALAALLGGRPIGAARWGLDRTEALLADCGHPERAFDAVLIAGTNGKGSAATIAAAVLAEHGHATGLYTSPHLTDPRERILVDGGVLSDALLTGCVERILASPAAGEATYFEVLTALAFLCFAEVGVDRAAVEVGLGGRLDATNVLAARGTGITSIGSDHSEFLGDTPAEVAREKAGIAKPGVPLVVGPVGAEAARAIRDVAEAVGAPVRRIAAGADRRGGPPGPDEIRIADVRTGWAGTGFVYVSARWPEGLALDTPMVGVHQAANAAVAIGTLEGLEPLDADAVRRGVARARVPGRFEVIERHGATWILDIAHNREGTAALRATLERTGPPRPWVGVVAILADKPWRDMLTALRVDMDAIIVTHAGSAPPERRWDLDAAVAELSRGGTGIRRVSTLGAALERAAELSRGGTVLITGSAYTVGEARALLAPGRSDDDGTDPREQTISRREKT